MDFFSSQKITNHITRIYLPGDVQAYLVEGMDKLHIAKLNGRVCGAKRPHSVFEQSICYLPV